MTIEYNCNKVCCFEEIEPGEVCLLSNGDAYLALDLSDPDEADSNAVRLCDGKPAWLDRYESVTKVSAVLTIS